MSPSSLCLYHWLSHLLLFIFSGKNPIFGSQRTSITILLQFSFFQNAQSHIACQAFHVYNFTWLAPNIQSIITTVHHPVPHGFAPIVLYIKTFISHDIFWLIKKIFDTILVESCGQRLLLMKLDHFAKKNK